MSDSKVIKLSALFSDLDKQILMNEFEDKLIVQKIVYLAQESGIDLGYDFEWYLRGPYCKEISGDAHKIIDSGIESTPTEAGLDEERIRAFKDVFQHHFNDPEWLEIAGSLVYLRKEHYQDRKINEIVGYLLNDLSCGYKNFSESIVRRVLVEILRIGIIA